MTLELSGRVFGKTIGAKSAEVRRTSHGVVLIDTDEILGSLKAQENKGYPQLDINAGDARNFVALSGDNFVLPNHGVDIVSLGHFGETIKFPGKATAEELTWTVRDFVDIPTADILDAWYSLTYNAKNGMLGDVYTYKVNAFVVLFGTGVVGGEPQKRRYYKLEGCYPSRIERGDIDHGGGDYVKIVASLVYDRVVPDFLIGDTSDNFAGSKGRDFALSIPENLD